MVENAPTNAHPDSGSTATSDTGDPGHPDGIEARIRIVGEGLVSSFGRVLAALPGGPHRPGELAQELRLSRDITSRLLNGMRADHPFAATHAMPGPEPLRRVLRAARRRDVDEQIIDDGETAVRRFELLIREEAGDRNALDAILGWRVPEVRAKFELASKQMMYKGISLLKGAQADLWVHTALVCPSPDDDDHHDVAFVYGTLGLRRLRPEAVVKFTYREFGVPGSTWSSISGRSPEEADGTELDAFCTRPPAPLDATHTGDGVVYALGGNHVGPRSAVDKLLAEIRRSAIHRRAADTSRNRKSLFVAPSVPVRLLVFDLLLHEDVPVAREPELIMFDSAVDGMASVNDPARDADRIELDETVQYLGLGAPGLRLTEMPNYREMLEHVTDRVGWDLSRFRAYRCRIQYPMHGLQACLAYDAPSA